MCLGVEVVISLNTIRAWNIQKTNKKTLRTHTQNSNLFQKEGKGEENNCHAHVTTALCYMPNKR